MISILFAFIFIILSCGHTYAQDNNPPTNLFFQIDYESAELFEEALNNGTDTDGKTVKFKVVKYVPNSILGVNCWAGKHLNFISTEQLKVTSGDTIVGRISKKPSKFLGSWKIHYDVLQLLPTGGSIEEENTPTTVNTPASEDGKIAIPKSSSYYLGKQYADVVSQIEQAGFTNISVAAQYDLYWGKDKEKTVASITIGDVDKFKSGDTFAPDTLVVLTYHMYYKDDPELRTYQGVVYDRAFYLSGKDGLRARFYSYYLFCESDHTVLHITHSTAGNGRTKRHYGVYRGSLDDSVSITWETWDFVTSLKKTTTNDHTYWVEDGEEYSEKSVESSLNEIRNW